MNPRHFRRPRLWHGIGWLLIISIIILSLTPPLPLPDIGAPNWSDKLGHFIAYFTLSAWYVQLVDNRRALGIHLLAFLLLGASIEILQSLSATRMGDWRDLLANTAGIGCGSLLWFTAARYWLQRCDSRL